MNNGQQLISFLCYFCIHMKTSEITYTHENIWKANVDILMGVIHGIKTNY